MPTIETMRPRARHFKTFLAFRLRQTRIAIYALLSVLVFGHPQTVTASESYPSGPVRIVVPFPPGGTIDLLARHLSPLLAERLGQRVVIDNRAGANGIIGTEAVARAPADGHTLLLVTASFAINQKAYKQLPYNVLEDFIPITPVASSVGFVMAVHPSVQAGNLKELISLSQQAGKQLNYSSPGIGNTIHLATELFKQRTGAKMLHVPYKGSAPALNALLAGEVQVEILPPGIALTNIQAGKIKVIAFTGKKRLPEMPTIPTMKESGVDLVFDGTWIGLFAPAKTPQPVVNKIYKEIKTLLAMPATQEMIRGDGSGYLADGRSPEEFAKQVKADVTRYGEIMLAAGIKPQQ